MKFGVSGEESSPKHRIVLLIKRENLLSGQTCERGAGKNEQEKSQLRIFHVCVERPPSERISTQLGTVGDIAN